MARAADVTNGKKNINLSNASKKMVENPPLWIWAVIVAALIASKFLWRWSMLRGLARELRRKTGK
jgi:hypothetical protein